MGIDYGSKRIGISLSDETKTIAFGKTVFENDDKCLPKILDFILNNKVSKIILGYPISLKGEKTIQTLDVESFEDKLKSFLKNDLGKENVEIVRWDERYTSKMAGDSMLRSGMKKKQRQNKSNLDIISSAILLQSYLDRTVHY